MLKYRNNESRFTGMGATEAIAEVNYYEKETLVSIPSLDAVERAKQWVEENQK